MKEFHNKVILISGGTGSFGKAFLKKAIESNAKEIRIFSRDELKQDNLRKLHQNPKLHFFIGDVRDSSSIDFAMRGVDYVFHAAALKQVPSCEFFPIEAVKTNILGTENLLNSAIKHNVKKVIVLSTDKAVYPINAMGISKAMMERIVLSKSINSSSTIIACTRYGNVMASRGSVIPLFLKQIKENKDITITDPNMTRFMMTLDNAVDLVIHAFENARPGDIFVQKSPASTVGLLANVLCEIMGKPNHPTRIIGTRHGEKLYETLLTKEEMARVIESEDFYQIPHDARDLNYEIYTSSGAEDISIAKEYHSHNTYRLNKDELISLLSQIGITG